MYENFTRSFLTQPGILVFEQNIDLISTRVDMLRLSATLIETLSGSSSLTLQNEERLWLLAHFIALQRANNQVLFHPLFLRALSMQLSTLSGQISSAFGAGVSNKKSCLDLPPYVRAELRALVDKDGVSGLLEKFTS